MIKRSHIRQFLAVVEEGGFTAAASRIRVTQPTLSAGIAELERLVGTPLFVRDRKHVRMTEAGARLLPIARSLEQNFRAADGLRLSEPRQWPTLKLGLLKTVAGPMAEAMIGALTGEFEIEMIDGAGSELRSAMSSGRLDMAISLQHTGESGAHVTPLVQEAYAMIVPVGHERAGAKSVAPEELASDVMIARRSCELLRETSRFFTRRGVRPMFSLRSENDDLCLRMVAAGLGITTAPVSFLIEGTTTIPIDGYDYERTIALIADPSRLGEDGYGRTAERVAQKLLAALDARRQPA